MTRSPLTVLYSLAATATLLMACTTSAGRNPPSSHPQSTMEPSCMGSPPAMDCKDMKPAPK
jgi:hypothetical protein